MAFPSRVAKVILMVTIESGRRIYFCCLRSGGPLILEQTLMTAGALAWMT